MTRVPVPFRGLNLVRYSSSTHGMRKARVLPEPAQQHTNQHRTLSPPTWAHQRGLETAVVPVLAAPRTSRPASSRGIHRACTSVMKRCPRSCTACAEVVCQGLVILRLKAACCCLSAAHLVRELCQVEGGELGAAHDARHVAGRCSSCHGRCHVWTSCFNSSFRLLDGLHVNIAALVGNASIDSRVAVCCAADLCSFLWHALICCCLCNCCKRCWVLLGFLGLLWLMRAICQRLCVSICGLQCHNGASAQLTCILKKSLRW